MIKNDKIKNNQEFTSQEYVLERKGERKIPSITHLFPGIVCGLCLFDPIFFIQQYILRFSADIHVSLVSKMFDCCGIGVPVAGVCITGFYSANSILLYGVSTDFFFYLDLGLSLWPFRMAMAFAYLLEKGKPLK
ncbi:MAG: hypothetical protein ACXWV8_09325 [Chitinophagaceae bacterium]